MNDFLRAQYDQARDTYLENLAYAAREVAKHDRTLLIEPSR